jgi:hypothetical protein
MASLSVAMAWGWSNMSIEAPIRTSLGVWIALLVGALDRDPHEGGRRLRQVVAGRRARITLDGEAVLVSMEDQRLVVAPDDPGAPLEGSGSTVSDVVLALLSGDLEVVAAIESGLIEVVGSPEAVTRMFHAVELILDGAARVPELRDLAASFILESRTESAVTEYDDEAPAAEMRLLRMLDLIDYAPPGQPRG